MSTPDDAAAADVEVFDTAAADAPVVDDDDGGYPGPIDDDREAPTESGGPPTPAGGGQDG